MKATILHESRGRVRFRLCQQRLTLRQADLLETWLQRQPWVRSAAVHERTRCVILAYSGERETVFAALRAFSWQAAEGCVTLPSHSTRALRREFEEKLTGKVLLKAASTLFLPPPLRAARVLWHMLPFMRRGLSCLRQRRIKVELLDALSIGISVARGDFGTAGSVMFLLELGELLEEWTRKKSVADLAQCMSLNVDRVWLRGPEGERLVPISQVRPGDVAVVRAGGVIPLDGLVLEGEAAVNQASLTGESIPVAKRPGGMVYAGTVVEEGECVLEVKQASGQSRYDQIVAMIQQSEQMKSAAESKAAELADRLVPYTFAGSLLSLLLTRNPARALSVLMVDFSCALKLAMPLAVLSAMRQAGEAHITVKGGKFLEAVARADVIVFDKTGTLTHACPRVVQVVPFDGREEREMLRLAACLEEHFPHSMANAVVEEARRRGLTHEEFHSRVEYLVAHGIASTVNGARVLIGSAHFITMDFGCKVGGYCSDMTRTIALGEPSAEMRKVYDTVLKAQLAGIAKAKAGVPGKEIHNAAAKVIEEAGYGPYFGHGFGHSVGIEIHESPNANSRDETPMPVGAAVSAEPGIYLPGKFGVRIEDVLIYTAEGTVDLTKSPKELIIL